MAAISQQLADITVLSIVVRILLSTFCAGTLGFERERHNQAAGFRTYIIVSDASALVMMTNIFVAGLGEKDLVRMSASVITGLGFLGAGTIIINARQQVKGLTTAAGLWASACLGLAIGAVTPAEIAVSICAQLVEHRRALPETEYPGTLFEQTNSDLSAIRYLAENAEPKALLLVLTSTGSTPVARSWPSTSSARAAARSAADAARPWRCSARGRSSARARAALSRST